MAISKRDLETAVLNWKVRAENAQARAEELEHALNLLVNDAVEWFMQQRTSDGAHHEFGIAVAFEVPIKSPTMRTIRGADVEHLPLIFWRTKWPAGDMFITVNNPEGFAGLRTSLLKPCANEPPNKELAELVECAAGGWEAAHRRYVLKREQPVIH